MYETGSEMDDGLSSEMNMHVRCTYCIVVRGRKYACQMQFVTDNKFIYVTWFEIWN